MLRARANVLPARVSRLDADVPLVAIAGTAVAVRTWVGAGGGAADWLTALPPGWGHEVGVLANAHVFVASASGLHAGIAGVAHGGALVAGVAWVGANIVACTTKKLTTFS